MKLKIYQVAHEIFSGHTFRSGVINDPEGDCAVIQMSSFDSSYATITKSLQKVKSNSVSEKHFLKPGDILFCAKGNNNFAFVFNEEYCAIAVSLFFVIRPDKEKISPQYLAWYINQEATQGELHSAKEGTSVSNISKKSLEELEIKVPSLFTQNKLVNLFKLWQVEKMKTMELVKEKDKFYNNMVLTEIEKEHEVPPFTDEYGQWMGYWLLSNHYIAHMKFRESIILKGNPQPVKELHAIITNVEQYYREIKHPNGSSQGYSAVKEWRVFKFSKTNLDISNGYTPIPAPYKNVEEAIIDTIPHSLIESITMVDRQGNIIK